MKATFIICALFFCQFAFGQNSITILPNRIVVKDGSVSGDVRTSTFTGSQLDLNGEFVTSSLYNNSSSNQTWDALDIGRNTRVSLTGTGNILRGITGGVAGQHIFLYTTNPITIKHLYSASGTGKIATPNGADYVLSPNGEDQETHLVRLISAWIIVK